ncbi:MAG: DinB family protein [Thermoanaerobaculia bacterium]
MTSPETRRPDPSEHLDYYGKYIALVPEGDLLAQLEEQMKETQGLLRGLPEERAMFRYGPDKWSIKEVVGHLIDAERIFAYRALRFSRNDATPLPGFEENDYVRNADFDRRTLASLLDEWEQARRTTVLFFRNLSDEAWDRRGTANDAAMSVRAAAWVIAGHERHHRGILRERYL